MGVAQLPVDLYELQRTRRREWALLLLVLAATAVAFGSMLSGDFLWIGTTGGALATPTLHAWLWSWTDLTGFSYQPVARGFLGVQYRLWQSWNPMGYHLVSLLLHMGSTLLLWLILRRLQAPLPLFAVALFALHPIAVQPLAWVTQQPIVLATTLALGSALAYMRGTRWGEHQWIEIDPDAPRWPRLMYAVSLLLFALTLLSSSIAMFLPLALLLAIWRQHGTISTDHLRKLAPLLGLLIISLALLLAGELRADGAEAWRLAPMHRLLLFGRLIGFHIAKFFYPHPLLLAYSNELHAWHLLYAIAAAGAVTVSFLLRRRIGRGLTACLLFFLLMLVPLMISTNLNSSISLVANWQQYLARVGLILIVTAAVNQLWERWLAGSAAARLAGVVHLIAIGLGVLAWQQGRTFASHERVWQHVLRHDRVCSMAHHEMSLIRIAEGDLEKAAEHLRAILACGGDQPQTNIELAAVLEKQGKSDQAMKLFQQAAANWPASCLAHLRLAEAYARKGESEHAARHFRLAIGLDPSNGQARNNYASFLARQGRVAEAMAQYRQALQLTPHAPEVHLNLANLLFSSGELESAAEHLQRAVQIDPRNFEAYMTAGTMLMQFKEFHQAARMFRQAIRIRPESAQAYNNLGVALAAQGQYDEAKYHFNRALDLAPDFTSARKNLTAATRSNSVAPATRSHSEPGAS